MALPCNNLNLNLYRVFYTVAKTKSFSESSRTLHISQPAISKHIQNLEYELNTILFYRTNRGIELTPEAKELLVYVEKAYNFLMLGEKQLQESKELMKGKVSIGVPTFISNYYLCDTIKKFMKEHPNIVIKMSNHSNPTLFNLMKQHTLDILIVPGNPEIPKDFKSVPLEKEKFCFVYNKEIMGEQNIDKIEDFKDKKILLPVKTLSQRKNIEELFNERGITTDPIMELESNEMMLNYVKEGIGIGYVLKSIAEKNPDLEIIDLKEEMPSEIITLVYNENTLTSSTKAFVNLLTKHGI